MMEVEILYKKAKVTALCESESVEGAFYRVEMDDSYWSCSCPSNQQGHRECKHVKAVKEEANLS